MRFAGSSGIGRLSMEASIDVKGVASNEATKGVGMPRMKLP